MGEVDPVLGCEGELRGRDGGALDLDVLSTAELTAFDQAYRTTTLPDVAALNSRPSLSISSR